MSERCSQLATAINGHQIHRSGPPGAAGTALYPQHPGAQDADAGPGHRGHHRVEDMGGEPTGLLKACCLTHSEPDVTGSCSGLRPSLTSVAESKMLIATEASSAEVGEQLQLGAIGDVAGRKWRDDSEVRCWPNLSRTGNDCCHRLRVAGQRTHPVRTGGGAGREGADLLSDPLCRAGLRAWAAWSRAAGDDPAGWAPQCHRDADAELDPLPGRGEPGAEPA